MSSGWRTSATATREDGICFQPGFERADVGGFDILECGSLEDAVEIAAGHPIAQMGTIEVRPLWGK